MTGPITPEAARAGIQARLGHHLPDRAAWHVAVLGAGSVGSTMADLLVRSGVRSLVLVDPDHVSAANLSRSVYTSLDVGRPKVEALADHLRRVAPDIAVTGLGAEVDDIDLDEVLDHVDLVLLATDDLAMEARAAHLAYHRGVPHVSVKMYARGEAGEVVLVLPEAGTACLQCATGRQDAPATALGAVDYGSGRLVGELALGPDIVAVCARGAKVVLALLARADGGPLAAWVAPLPTERGTLFLSSSVDAWGVFGLLPQLPWGGPFSGLWVQTRPAPECPVCGTGRVRPSTPATEPDDAARVLGLPGIPTVPPPGARPDDPDRSLPTTRS